MEKTKMKITIKEYTKVQDKILSYDINKVYVDNRKDNNLILAIKRTINLLRSRLNYENKKYGFSKNDGLKDIEILKETLKQLEQGKIIIIPYNEED